jgi:hypothetical protein
MPPKDPEKRREGARVRARAYYYANREAVCAKNKDKRENDPSVRERERERHALLDPERKAKKLEANRERYRQVYSKDPAYREYMSSYHKKMKATIAPEAMAEQHLRERVEALGGICPKFIDPSRRGAPDRMVIMPGKPIYFVEMKRYKLGTVKPWQERYHADLRACGHEVRVLWSKEEVDEFLAAI